MGVLPGIPFPLNSSGLHFPQFLQLRVGFFPLREAGDGCRHLCTLILHRYHPVPAFSPPIPLLKPSAPPAHHSLCWPTHLYSPAMLSGLSATPDLPQHFFHTSPETLVPQCSSAVIPATETKHKTICLKERRKEASSRHQQIMQGRAGHKDHDQGRTVSQHCSLRTLPRRKPEASTGERPRQGFCVFS